MTETIYFDIIEDKNKDKRISKYIGILSTMASPEIARIYFDSFEDDTDLQIYYFYIGKRRMFIFSLPYKGIARRHILELKGNIKPHRTTQSFRGSE